MSLRKRILKNRERKEEKSNGDEGNEGNGELSMEQQQFLKWMENEKFREQFKKKAGPWVSRRDVGKAGAAGLAALLGGSALSQKADAYNASNETIYGKGLKNVKQVGSAAEPVEKLYTEQESITKARRTDLSSWNPHLIRGPESDTFPQFSLYNAAKNPVLVPADVSDQAGVTGVADPFWRVVDGTHHMFFEVIGNENNIGHATSKDGLNWTYDQIVLDNANYSPSRFAYPHFWLFDDTFYLVPDTSGDVYLFSASPSDFPTNWTEEGKIFSPTAELHDFTPFYLPEQQQWYAIADDVTNGNVTLYYDSANTIVPTNWSWTEHPSSPLASAGGLTDGPAGRAVVTENGVYLPMQTDNGTVAVHKLTNLTTSSCAFTETNGYMILSSGRDSHHFNITHHIEMVPAVTGMPLAAMDGVESGGTWSVSIVSLGTVPLCAEVELTGTQNIAGDDSWDQIELDNQVLDTGINHDNNTYKYTVPADGIYELQCFLTWDSVVAAPTNGYPIRIQMRIYNETQSSTVWTGIRRLYNSEGNLRIIGSPPYLAVLNRNDVLKMQVRQDSGDILTAQGGQPGTRMKVNRKYLGV